MGVWGELRGRESTSDVWYGGARDVGLFEDSFALEYDGRVVFSNGMGRRDNRLLIYYGAADQSTCLAECSIAQIIGL